MNERFNDLRLDAGISRLHEVPYMVAVNKEGEIIEPLDGLQKFAELIVKECIDTVLDCTVEYTTRPQVANEIKQHFGVE